VRAAHMLDDCVCSVHTYTLQRVLDSASAFTVYTNLNLTMVQDFANIAQTCTAKTLFVTLLPRLHLTVDAHASCAQGRELESQRLAKSYTALQTVGHRFNNYTSSCVTFTL